MIRPMTPDDIPGLAVMGVAFHEAGGFDELEYVPDDFATSLGNLIVLDSFIGVIAEGHGAAAGLVCPVYFNLDHLSGEELFWWVNPGSPPGTGLRLLDALEEAAQAKGCRTWQMKSIDRLNGERMAKLYERRGYRAFEHSFIKRF